MPFLVAGLTLVGGLVVNNYIHRKQNVNSDVERYVDEAIANVFSENSEGIVPLELDIKLLVDESKLLAKQHEFSFSSKEIKKALVLINSKKINLDYIQGKVSRNYSTQKERGKEILDFYKTINS